MLIQGSWNGYCRSVNNKANNRHGDTPATSVGSKRPRDQVSKENPWTPGLLDSGLR